jgi:hypothetical protein
MKKNILSIAIVLALILSLGIVNAAELNKNNNTNTIFAKFKSSEPTFYDMVRCTCNGEACGSSFESHPNASIGGLIVYCSRICSCRKKVGFQYETEE